MLAPQSLCSNQRGHLADNLGTEHENHRRRPPLVEACDGRVNHASEVEHQWIRGWLGAGVDEGRDVAPVREHASDPAPVVVVEQQLERFPPTESQLHAFVPWQEPLETTRDRIGNARRDEDKAFEHACLLRLERPGKRERSRQLRVPSGQLDVGDALVELALQDSLEVGRLVMSGNGAGNQSHFEASQQASVAKLPVFVTA
jgi:hypothetical protein